MMTSHKWTTFGLLTLLQACGNPFDIKSSCESGFYTTTSNERMQWPEGSRIEFQMHASLPENIRDVVAASGDRYNDVFKKTSLHIIDSEEIDTPDFKGNVSEVSGDNINGIYWVREKDWAWSESDPEAVAMTVISFSRTGIAESDVFFRAKVFKRETHLTASNATVSNETSQGMPLDFLFGLGFNSKNSIASAAYNLASSNPNPAEHQVFMVSVHEMGHAIGRCHSDDPASIMYPEVGSGSEEDRESPLSEGDLDILSQAYKL